MKLKLIGEQVVVVMGASSGIGRETALRFAKRGAKLVVSARSQEKLDSLVAEIQASGGEVVAIAADVTDFEQVKAVADRAAEEYGRLDTWVHLPGVSVYGYFEDIEPEEFKRVVDIDLMGQVYGARAALPHLKREGRGSLIHISSVIAKRAAPLQSAYSAAKHGVDGFLESLRVELRHQGLKIGVTNVMPASINTPFFNNARTKMGVKPMGLPPIYEPRIVADAILYSARRAPRDIVVGGAGKALIWNQRLSPRLMDAFMLATGFRFQHTNEPKTTVDPDAVDSPVEAHDTVEGDFGEGSIRRSLATWLDTHPAAKGVAVAGTVLGVASVAASRSLRNGAAASGNRR